MGVDSNIFTKNTVPKFIKLREFVYLWNKGV